MPCVACASAVVPVGRGRERVRLVARTHVPLVSGGPNRPVARRPVRPKETLRAVVGRRAVGRGDVARPSWEKRGRAVSALAGSPSGGTPLPLCSQVRHPCRRVRARGLQHGQSVWLHLRRNDSVGSVVLARSASQSLPIQQNPHGFASICHEAGGFPACSRWLRSEATTPPETHAKMKPRIPAGMPAPGAEPGWHPSRVRRFIGIGDRWCRFAQPPAACCETFGFGLHPRPRPQGSHGQTREPKDAFRMDQGHESGLDWAWDNTVPWSGRSFLGAAVIVESLRFVSRPPRLSLVPCPPTNTMPS
jgi:hypothetical protein